MSNLVVLLGHQVVVGPWAAHELKGTQVESGQDGVALAAWGVLAIDCRGLASAH